MEMRGGARLVALTPNPSPAARERGDRQVGVRVREAIFSEIGELRVFT